MTNSKFNSCNKKFIYYFGMKMSYTSWKVTGPRQKFLFSPSGIYCDDADTPKFIGRIPIKFRNNEMSFFLTALSIINHPWREKYKDSIEYPDDLYFSTNKVAETCSRIQISTGKDDGVAVFIGNNIYPSIEVDIPKKWNIHLCKIFGFEQIIITDINQLHLHLNEDGKINIKNYSDRSILTISAKPLAVPTLDMFIKLLIPDEKFITEQIYEVGTLNTFEYIYSISSSKQHDIDIIIFVLKISLEKVNSVLRFIGVTGLKNGKELVSQILYLINSAPIKLTRV